LFRSTWIIGTLGQSFPFGNLGRLLYGFVATNRYSLSKCRGGACRVARPEVVRRQSRLGAFWSCYTLGFLIRLPLVLWAGIKAALQRTSIFARTYHRRLDLLDGKLTILFLNGVLPNTVPLLFGELFTTIIYDGVAVDPGSPKMRRSLARHLRQLNPKITKVIATHAHEEHVGNLNWLAEATGAPVYVSEMTARFLTPFKKLPWVRDLTTTPCSTANVFHVHARSAFVRGCKQARRSGQSCAQTKSISKRVTSVLHGFSSSTVKGPRCPQKAQ
jgi:hypothetical protein